MWASRRKGRVYTVEIGRRAQVLSPFTNLDIFYSMKFTAALSTLLLAAPALAQTTPSGFAPATNATLDVYYGTQYISPGIVVKKSSKQIPFIGNSGS